MWSGPAPGRNVHSMEDLGAFAVVSLLLVVVIVLMTFTMVFKVMVRRYEREEDEDTLPDRE